MRRALGLLLLVGGLGLLGFVGTGYGRGLMDRDAARTRWAAIEARAAVRSANAHLADNPGPIAQGTPVSRLLVPHIDLDEVIVEGVGDAVLNAGPGHMPGTPLPGGAGNAVVSAHRDMHFRRLAELGIGDTVVTVTEYHRTTWRITGRRIVAASAASIFPTPELHDWLPPPPLRATAAVVRAVQAGRPLVALETSVLSQGLPIPANAQAYDEMAAAVSAAGAEPVVTAVVRGVPSLGMEPSDLARFLACDGVSKVSARDLGAAMANGLDGATTVAATLALCTHAGIQLFATGGIGGVHREPAFDESADLVELGRSPVIVVCAGAKSILDLPGTLERLETLGVPVIGYRTREMPGFFTVGTGLPLSMYAETAEEVAQVFLAGLSIGRPGALLVVQPPPANAALPQGLVDDAIVDALAAARRAGVRGALVTPFLLSAVNRATGGRSLAANLALLEANSWLAGEIALALQSLTKERKG